MTAGAITAGASYASWATALAAAADAATIAGGVYSGVNSYQQGKAAQASYKAQATELERQAKLNNERAGIAQIQGEQQAEKRSRQLANAIGSMYANYAGNGLAVDGASKDTLGNLLTTQAGEAAADISTINDNTALNVWTYQENARSQLASAANARRSGKAAYRAGVNGAIGSGIQTVGSLALGGVSMYGTASQAVNSGSGFTSSWLGASGAGGNAGGWTVGTSTVPQANVYGTAATKNYLGNASNFYFPKVGF